MRGTTKDRGLASANSQTLDNNRPMYLPKHFDSQDLSLAHQLMAEQPLALLVGPDADGQSFGTHVPLGVIQAGDHAGSWLLEGHMARANPHWAWLRAQASVLAVFSGPSAYISPAHYDTKLAVPTWNYIAVHVYGTLKLIDDLAGKDALLKRLIAQHEPGYAEQWRGLPTAYQDKMLNAIVGFRLQVTRWEGKFKLSQNRPAPERRRIQDAFAEGTANEQALARWMAQLGL